MEQNDGREVKGWLPKLSFSEPDPVVQVRNLSKDEVLYTVRIQGTHFQPKVYSHDFHEVRVGRNLPENLLIQKVKPVETPAEAKEISVNGF
jgi:hypothetical protein